jgi:hypothetical protein
MENFDDFSLQQQDAFLITLEQRFRKHPFRHEAIEWGLVEKKLVAKPEKLFALFQMEMTGGEPDVIEANDNAFVFYDCAIQSPTGRRSLCYDREALDARKEFKPDNDAMGMAKSMGIELLTEAKYRLLQSLHPIKQKLDTKSSSWIKTPDDIRALGGALFADYRYGQVFVYHNSAPSYYGSRGFRGCISV